nr:hypothetical protein [Tanacetum cinerariifolium]
MVIDVPRLQALVDKKKVINIKATIRDALRLDDAEGIKCLPNEEIFTELARMRYGKPSTKLIFYKAFFSSRKINFSKYIFDRLVRNVDSSTKFYMYPRFLQLMIRAQVGDLSLHSTKYSSPTLTHKVFVNIKRVGKGYFGVETPLFVGMIVEQQVGEGADEVHVKDVHAAGVADEGAATVADDDVTAVVNKPSPTPPTQLPPPSQDIPSTSQAQPTPPQLPQAQPQLSQQQPQPSQDAEISMDLLHNLLDTCTTLTRRVENLEHDKIAQALEITKLKQRVKKLEMRNKLKVLKLRRLKRVGTAQRVETFDDTVMDDVSKQGRMITDMDAYVDVTLKDIAKDVALDAEIEEMLLEGEKGVVIRDLEETATPSTIIHSEAESKDKRILRKEKDDNDVKRYQALKRKPQNKAQARKNMMIYLRNIARFKMDYFKGMIYDDIRPIFEKNFNSNVAFLLKTKEQMDEEDSRALKRLSESQEDKTAKKQKLDEEVAELRKHLMIVPNNDDDVYTEATPLALKVLVVDYKIYTENNKPYYKIKRADDLHELYLSFHSMLRNFDREDLEMITFTITQLILLVERKYPLTRFTLEQILNNMRLEVEEESEVSLELLRFIRKQHQEGFRLE